MAIKQFYPEISPSLNLDFANSKTVDPRITFTRASTATYYDGKTVAKAEENLFTYSQQLSNASWLKNNITVADNAAVAPDGTTTAARIQTSGVHFIGKVPGLVTGLTYLLSFYVKSNTGVDQTFTSLYGAGVQPTHVATSEWTRIVRVVTAIGFGTIYPIGNNDTAAPALDLLVWGFQLERRDTVTTYTPTTSQPITRYQPVLLTAPANTPRIDHDPITVECKGLLIEESRTNLLNYSEQFDNTAWAESNSTIGSNVMVAPDGTLTADKLIDSISSSEHSVSQLITTTATAMTFSVFAKKQGRDFLWMSIKNNSDVSRKAYFSLALGTVGTTETGITSSIASVGNGWYRCIITIASAFAGTNIVTIGAANADNTPSYTGNDLDGVLIWGAQLETGAFPTSYIKTEASQVTRAADNASMTGTNFSSWYRQDAFTLTADVAPIGGVSSFAVSINNNFDQRALALQYCGGTGNIRRQAETFVNPTSYSPAPTRAELSRGSRTKVAASFKVGGYANNSFDGDIALGTIQIPRLPEHSALHFGNSFIPGTVAWTGHIRRVTGYPIDLSPTNLQALTL